MAKSPVLYELPTKLSEAGLIAKDKRKAIRVKLKSPRGFPIPETEHVTQKKTFYNMTLTCGMLNPRLIDQRVKLTTRFNLVPR
jgi:hypothetical protein